MFLLRVKVYLFFKFSPAHAFVILQNRLMHFDFYRYLYLLLNTFFIKISNKQSNNIQKSITHGKSVYPSDMNKQKNKK